MRVIITDICFVSLELNKLELKLNKGPDIIEKAIEKFWQRNFTVKDRLFYENYL